LAGALERRGVPTATGGTALVVMAARAILTNPKYCGQGRTLLWQTKYESRTRSRYQHCTRRAAYPRPDDLPEAMAGWNLPFFAKSYPAHHYSGAVGTAAGEAERSWDVDPPHGWSQGIPGPLTAHQTGRSLLCSSDTRVDSLGVGVSLRAAAPPACISVGPTGENKCTTPHHNKHALPSPGLQSGVFRSVW